MWLFTVFLFICLFIHSFIYFFERGRERERCSPMGGEGQREVKRAPSRLQASAEPNAGLDPTSLRS